MSPRLRADHHEDNQGDKNQPFEKLKPTFHAKKVPRVKLCQEKRAYHTTFRRKGNREREKGAGEKGI